MREAIEVRRERSVWEGGWGEGWRVWKWRGSLGGC